MLLTGVLWWSLSGGTSVSASRAQAAAGAATAGQDVVGVGGQMHAGATSPVAAPGPAAPPSSAPTVSSPSAPAGPVVSTPPNAPPTTAHALPPASAPPPAAAAATPAAAPTAIPASVAQIAGQIIAAVDQLSGGRYRIRPTSDNLLLLGRWMANEGGLWADNPLNTSLDSGMYPHQFTTSGVDTGIPIFPTMHQGAVATAKTLLQNPAYARILSVLSTGDASCTTFATAVIRSPWASSHYGYDPGTFCGLAPSQAWVPGKHRTGHPHHRVGKPKKARSGHAQ